MLQFTAIADVMPRDCYSQPKQFLHFVQNSSDHDSDGKLFKIKPILDAVRNEFIKIEPEQFRSEDDQKFGLSWLKRFYLQFLPLLWKRRGE